MQIYKNQKDLTAALENLAAEDKKLAAAFDKYGTPPLNKRVGGFSGMAKILVSQQVSTAAATTIYNRFEEAIGEVRAENLLAMEDAALAACGLSRPKQRYLKLLAEAVLDGTLDFKKLDRQDDSKVYETLLAQAGIGPWSAECYLLFCLRRADLFPAGDLALQHGVRMMYGLDDKPTAEALADFARRWQPYRGAAARLLWVYYNGELAERRAR